MEIGATISTEVTGSVSGPSIEIRATPSFWLLCKRLAKTWRKHEGKTSGYY
jgi:hypothetical protein